MVLKVTESRLLSLSIVLSLLGNEATYGLPNASIWSALGKILPFLIILYLVTEKRIVKLNTVGVLAICVVFYSITHRLIIILFDLSTYGVAPWHLYLNFVSCILFYMYFSYSDSSQTPRKVETVMETITYCGLIYAAVSLAGLVDGRFYGYPMRFIGAYTALYYLSSVIFLPYQRKSVVFFVFAMTPLIVVIHKPAITSIIVGIIAVLFISFINRRYSIRSIYTTLSISGFIFCIFYLFNFLSSGQVAKNLDYIYKYQFLHKRELDAGLLSSPFEAFFGGRLSLWQTAVDRIYSNPYFGYGFYQTVDEQVRYVVISDIPFHNGYLDMILSLGVFGTLPVMFIFILGIRGLFFGIRSTSRWYRMYSMACFGMLSAVSFYNLGGTSVLFYTINIF
jgi:O-antigen ligase